MLREVVAGHVRPILTVPLVLEYEAVIGRRVPWMTEEDCEAFLEGFCAVSDARTIYFLWRPFLRDPEDDMVLEAAVEGQAQRIVTHNVRDFVGVEERFGVRVVRPQTFLSELGGEA